MSRAHRLGALATLLALCLSSEVAAHHVVSENGVAWVEPVSVVEVTLQTASFDLGPDWRGQWWTLTPAVEWRLGQRFSLMGRLPIAMILLDDGRGVMGLADAEVSAKGLLWSSAHGGLVLSAGAGAELPTGSTADALGAGHVELTPFIALSTQPWERLILNTLLAERISLEGDQAQSHSGSPLSVHAAHELQVRQSASWVQGPVYGTLGLDKIFVWSDGEPAGPLSARAELGLASPSAWRLSLSFERTIAGQARSLWRSQTSLAWMF